MSEQKPPRTRNQHLTVLLTGIVALIYLLNPLGLIDLIPDFVPVIGNLDDATAVLILLNVLRFYGIDLARWFDFVNPADDNKVIEGEIVEVDREDLADDQET